MKEFSETVFKYVEKLLPPYQFWAVLTLVSASLLLLPDALVENLGLENFVDSYKGYISLVLIVSAAILVVKVFGYSLRWILSRKPVNAENLTDEEKAILVFFHQNHFESFRANREYPAIKSLIARGFISEILSFIIVAGNPYEGFQLTPSGKRRLRSQKFIDQISKPFSTNQHILNFINSISEKSYSTHNPHQFD